MPGHEPGNQVIDGIGERMDRVAEHRERAGTQADDQLDDQHHQVGKPFDKYDTKYLAIALLHEVYDKTSTAKDRHKIKRGCHIDMSQATDRFPAKSGGILHDADALFAAIDNARVGADPCCPTFLITNRSFPRQKYRQPSRSTVSG